MDYEAIDREMSSWMVSCIYKGTRFYLTDAKLGTDIPGRAALYRWHDQALDVAISENQDEAWRGLYVWSPRRVAQDKAEQ